MYPIVIIMKTVSHRHGFRPVDRKGDRDADMTGRDGGREGGAARRGSEKCAIVIVTAAAQSRK